MTEGRRRRVDGERSRRAILASATELATLEGLEGLSIARLAGHAGMSKSGLYAHFGSKRELQLATIEAAERIYAREVVEPALRRPEGVSRILALCDAFLSYLERGVFPGGCFFAATAAELDSLPGPVADRVREFHAAGTEMLLEQIGAAQRLGELDRDLDAEQLAFELDSLLLGANASFVLFSQGSALERARRAVRARLAVQG